MCLTKVKIMASLMLALTMLTAGMVALAPRSTRAEVAIGVAAPKSGANPRQAVAAPPAKAVDPTEAERALKTDDAVVAGLQWLARRQMGDGRWRLEAGTTRNDVAATAFALLPLLGAGNTPKITDALHPYARAVERGLKFLVNGQGADGAFAPDMYAHALATRRLRGVPPHERSRARSARPARHRLHRQAQHEAGGWRYAPGQAGDTSVTSYQVVALASARRASLNVPKETLTRTGKYLDSAASNEGSGYSYVPGSPSSITMTAAGHLCRLELGGKTDDKGLIQWIASVRTTDSA